MPQILGFLRIVVKPQTQRDPAEKQRESKAPLLDRTESLVYNREDISKLWYLDMVVRMACHSSKENSEWNSRWRWVRTVMFGEPYGTAFSATLGPSAEILLDGDLPESRVSFLC